MQISITAFSYIIVLVLRELNTQIIPIRQSNIAEFSYLRE